MAQTALRPAVVDFVQLATQRRQPGSGDGADQGRRRVVARRALLIDANLRQRFGVIVVGIQRAGGRMEFNPDPQTPS